MKFTAPTLFTSANPYRDWFFVLTFLLLSAAGIAVLDARFFLSSTGQTATDGKELSVMQLDKDALVRAAAMLQDKEKRFNALRR